MGAYAQIFVLFTIDGEDYITFLDVDRNGRYSVYGDVKLMAFMCDLHTSTARRRPFYVDNRVSIDMFKAVLVKIADMSFTRSKWLVNLSKLDKADQHEDHGSIVFSAVDQILKEHGYVFMRTDASGHFTAHVNPYNVILVRAEIGDGTIRERPPDPEANRERSPPPEIRQKRPLTDRKSVV